MAVNGENVAGVARDGNKAEPVTVAMIRSRMRSLELKGIDLELTVFLDKHSL